MRLGRRFTQIRDELASLFSTKRMQTLGLEVFEGCSAQEVERDVNLWLIDKDVEVVRMCQSECADSNGDRSLTVSVLYKEKRSNQ